MDGDYETLENYESNPNPPLYEALLEQGETFPKTKNKESLAEKLVYIGLEKAELWSDLWGEVWAKYEINGIPRRERIRSIAFRDYLIWMLWRTERRVVGKRTVSIALMTLEALTRTDFPSPNDD